MPKWRRLLGLLDFPEAKALWSWWTTPPLKGQSDHEATRRMAISGWNRIDGLENAIYEYKRRIEVLDDEIRGLKLVAKEYFGVIEKYREYFKLGQMNFLFICGACNQEIREPAPPELRFIDGTAVQRCALCVLDNPHLKSSRQIRPLRGAYIRMSRVERIFDDYGIPLDMPFPPPWYYHGDAVPATVGFELDLVSTPAGADNKFAKLRDELFPPIVIDAKCFDKMNRKRLKFCPGEINWLNPPPPKIEEWISHLWRCLLLAVWK